MSRKHGEAKALKDIGQINGQKGEPMSDLISRLSELRSQYNCFKESERDAYRTLSEAIGALKLASDLHQTCVTDAKGHWIIFPPFIEEICMCSNCKTKFKEAYQYRDTCPSCGAKMEGSE